MNIIQENIIHTMRKIIFNIFTDVEFKYDELTDTEKKLFTRQQFEELIDWYNNPLEYPIDWYNNPLEYPMVILSYKDIQQYFKCTDEQAKQTMLLMKEEMENHMIAIATHFIKTYATLLMPVEKHTRENNEETPTKSKD